MAVATDVSKKIKQRRQDAANPGVPTDAQREHLIKAKRFLDGLDEVVVWMTGAVIAMLSEHVDDLNTAEPDFRFGFQRCIRRLLTTTAQRQEKLVFLHEALPGFTVLAVKKDGWGQALPAIKTASVKTKKAPPQDSLRQEDELVAERQQVIQSIVGAYVNRTGNRVLVIEGSDVVLVMFPVSDLKKNLQDMGFWNHA